MMALVENLGEGKEAALLLTLCATGREVRRRGGVDVARGRSGSGGERRRRSVLGNVDG